MTTTLQEMLARWDSPDGHPYKGMLIDWDVYGGDGEEPPKNIGCMCAQGQVLYLLGGWTPRRIKYTGQDKADTAVAELLNISRAHAILLRRINDTVDGAPSIVLTDPGKILGGQWSKLLDFWWHLHQMTERDWAAAWDAVGDAAWDAARDAARAAARAAAWDAAWDAVRDAVGDAARDAAWDAARAAARAAARDAAWDAARDAARAAARDAARAAARDAARDAAWEIQGSSIYEAADRPFFFLPLFGFATPADIPQRPENYGQ